VATQGSVNTRMGVERCVRYAFDLAEGRSRKHLTLVHKTNVLTFAGDLWQRTFDEVASEFPDVGSIVEEVVPNSRVTYAPGASPDTRNYRVDFSKIERRVPGFAPKWTVRQGGEGLLAA